MRALAVMLAAIVAAPAAGQPKPAPAGPSAEALEQARALFIAGSEAYREHKYIVAIDAFEAALELAPRGSIVFALAQAQRLQYFLDGQPERLEKAVGLYRQYIDRDDAEMEQERTAMRHLEGLTPQLQAAARKQDDSIGRLIVSADVDGATARIGDQVPMDTPATFEVEPGPLRVIVEAPGYQPAVRETVVVGGSAVAVPVELAPLPGRLMVRTDEGAEIRIDGRSLGAAPMAPLDLAPGTHRVVVLASGREAFFTDVAVASTREVTLDAPLEMTGQRVAAWSLFGLAGALAVTGGVMVGFALDEEAEAEAAYAIWESDGLYPDEAAAYEGHVTDRDTWTDRAIAVGVGAGVAAGLGAVLWLLDEPRAPSAPVLTPTVAPDGSGAGLVGAFTF